MSRNAASLNELLDNPRVWRGRQSLESQDGLASGYPELDRHLPGRGWPQGALTELLAEHYGIGELRLLMPALARLSRQPADYSGPGWIAWVAPPFQPYAPALEQWNIDLSRLLIVRPKTTAETLWSAEQALSSGTCAAVLLWPESLDDQAGRRLQLAAEKGNSWAIAFRPPAARRQSSAAALRLELQATVDGTRIHILKSRGGRPAVLHNVL